MNALLTKEGVRNLLDRLRARVCNHREAKILVYDIKAEVANWVTTWDELGSSELEVDNLVRQAPLEAEDVKHLLTQLMKSEDRSEAHDLAGDIKTAVARGITTWKELGSSEAGVDRLVSQTK